jgi:hypothetical protein
VRPVVLAIIQGGMTLRLMSPHSRLKKGHEERREGERGQRAENEERRGTAQLVCSARFQRLVNKCGCMCVGEGLHNEQHGVVLVGHVATVVGRQRSRSQPQHNEPLWHTNNQQIPTNRRHSIHSKYCTRSRTLGNAAAAHYGNIKAVVECDAEGP